VLEYLVRTQTSNDDFVGAPSGLGYIYPSTWPHAALADFAALTSTYLNKTSIIVDQTITAVNVIGDPCVGGGFSQNCPPLTQPNMSALAPLLAQPNVWTRV
jgi:hypothetical protein